MSKKVGRGKWETEKLIRNVEDQLGRLLMQLQDLEELKDDFEEDEYEETKAETLEQLKEFDQTLQKMMTGDLGLVDKFAAMQLGIQAAISDAFKTPEVIAAFAKREPGQLRQRLEDLKGQVKLKRMSKDQMMQQAVEILTALKKLGEELTPQEEEFLQEHMTASLAQFEKASTDLGSQGTAQMLKVAGSNVRQAQGE